MALFDYTESHKGSGFIFNNSIDYKECTIVCFRNEMIRFLWWNKGKKTVRTRKTAGETLVLQIENA